MRRVAIGVIVLGLLAFAPVRAHAQSYVTPFAGWDFGGDAGNCPSLLEQCSVKRTAFGVSVGHLWGGVFGFEEDFSYAPDFFGKSPTFGANSVLTLMTDATVAVPAGPLRPYLSAGIGLLRTRVNDLEGLLSLDNSGLGYNVGGGAMVLFSRHLGLRFDIRHFRSNSTFNVPALGLPSSNLSFSRFSVGLVLH
jgi:opacity protein-like surface antigen